MALGRIVVTISDQALARVLAIWLSDALEGRTVIRAPVTEVAEGDVVVVTPHDCDAVTAAEMVARGAHLIALTPVFRRDEAARYERAGAKYLVMTVDDNGDLIEAVRAASKIQSARPALRTVSSHLLSPKRSAS